MLAGFLGGLLAIWITLWFIASLIAHILQEEDNA